MPNWMSINTKGGRDAILSSHRDLQGSKMRFLILSAFVACAAAAPSGLLAPVAVAPSIPIAPVLPVAYSAIAPTISPGDIEAAAINAQVKVNNLAIAAVDKAREQTDLAVENVNEQLINNNDQLKERAIEEFWGNEERKWQALDAINTAEAKLDGSVASNADALAKSALTPVAVAAVAPAVAAPSIAVAPIAPVIAPGIVAPVLKTVEVKEEKLESLVKTAEKDSITVEAEKIEEKPLLKDEKSVIASIATPLSLDALKYPIVAPVVIPPMLKYGAVPYLQTVSLTPQILAPQIGLIPTVYKTW